MRSIAPGLLGDFARPAIGAVLYRGQPVQVVQGDTGFLPLLLPLLGLSMAAGGGMALGGNLFKKLFSALSPEEKVVYKQMESSGASKQQLHQYVQQAAANRGSGGGGYGGGGGGGGGRSYSRHLPGDSSPIPGFQHFPPPREAARIAYGRADRLRRMAQNHDGGGAPPFRPGPRPGGFNHPVPGNNPFVMNRPGAGGPVPGNRPDLTRMLQTQNRGNGDWDPSWGDIDDGVVNDLSAFGDAIVNEAEVAEGVGRAANAGNKGAVRTALEKALNPGTSVVEIQGLATGLGTQNSGDVGSMVSGVLSKLVDLAVAIAESNIDFVAVSALLGSMVDILRPVAESALRIVTEEESGDHQPLYVVDADRIEGALSGALAESSVADVIKTQAGALQTIKSGGASSGDVADAVLSAAENVPILGRLAKAARDARLNVERGGSALRSNVDLNSAWVEQIAQLSPSPMLSSAAAQAEGVLMRSASGPGFFGNGVVYGREVAASRMSRDILKSHPEADAIVLQLGGGQWWLPYQSLATGAVSIPRGSRIPFVYDGRGGETGLPVDGILLDTFTAASGNVYTDVMYVAIPTRALQSRQGVESISALGTLLFARFLTTNPTAPINPAFGMTYSSITDVAGAVSTMFNESWQLCQTVGNSRQGTISPATGNQAWYTLPDPFWLGLSTGIIQGADSYIVLKFYPLSIGAGPGFVGVSDRPVMGFHFYDPAAAQAVFNAMGLATRDVLQLTWKSLAQNQLSSLLGEVARGRAIGVIPDINRPSVGGVANLLGQRLLG